MRPILPATGARFTWQSKTFMNTDIRRRGPALVVATRRLVAVGEPGYLTPPAAADGRYPLAQPAADTVLSLDFSLPIEAVPKSALKPQARVDVRVELAGGELLDCLPRRSQLRVLRCLTPRCHVGPGAVLVVTGAATGPPVIRTQAWRGGPAGEDKPLPLPAEHRKVPGRHPSPVPIHLPPPPARPLDRAPPSPNVHRLKIPRNPP